MSAKITGVRVGGTLVWTYSAEVSDQITVRADLGLHGGVMLANSVPVSVAD